MVSHYPNLSISDPLQEILIKWSSSENYPKIGLIAARLVGIPGMPIARITDVALNILVGSSKILIGAVIVAPINIVGKLLRAKELNTTWTVSQGIHHLGVAVLYVDALISPWTYGGNVKSYKDKQQQKLTEKEQALQSIKEVEAVLKKEKTSLEQQLQEAQKKLFSNETQIAALEQNLVESKQKEKEVKLELEKVKEEIQQYEEFKKTLASSAKEEEAVLLQQLEEAQQKCKELEVKVVQEQLNQCELKSDLITKNINEIKEEINLVEQKKEELKQLSTDVMDSDIDSEWEDELTELVPEDKGDDLSTKMQGREKLGNFINLAETQQLKKTGQTDKKESKEEVPQEASQDFRNILSQGCQRVSQSKQRQVFISKLEAYELIITQIQKARDNGTIESFDINQAVMQITEDYDMPDLLQSMLGDMNKSSILNKVEHLEQKIIPSKRAKAQQKLDELNEAAQQIIAKRKEELKLAEEEQKRNEAKKCVLSHVVQSKKEELEKDQTEKPKTLIERQREALHKVGLNATKANSLQMVYVVKGKGFATKEESSNKENP